MATSAVETGLMGRPYGSGIGNSYSGGNHVAQHPWLRAVRGPRLDRSEDSVRAPGRPDESRDDGVVSRGARLTLLSRTARREPQSRGYASRRDLRARG